MDEPWKYGLTGLVSALGALLLGGAFLSNLDVLIAWGDSGGWLETTLALAAMGGGFLALIALMAAATVGILGFFCDF